MVETNAAISATFLVYLALMLGIGVWAYQSTKGSSGYFVGGRSLGPWPTALSAGIRGKGDVPAGFDRFKEALGSAD